jgi:hypothetical protein
MVLEMDERAIPQLLVACGNAALPVEVQQVRLNVERSATGRAGGMRGGEEGGGRGGAPTIVQPKVRHDTVTIQGIVYIFNPPDKTKLEIVDEPAEPGTATETAPADATTPTTETPVAAGDPATEEPASEEPPATEPVAAEPEAEPATQPAERAVDDPAAPVEVEVPAVQPAAP